jgi:hypothetical protein
MQNDPTPSDNGDSLPPACAEDATVELGAITTELGLCTGEDQGSSGGGRGWWPWGMGHGG